MSEPTGWEQGHWTAPPPPQQGNAQQQWPMQPQHQQWAPPSGPAQPWAPQQPDKPRRRTGLIASVAAVVVIAGGGAATYVAFSASSSSGASTPKAAVQKAIGDLQNSDLVGFLDDLAPGERDAMSSPVRDDISHLKRLHVVKSATNPSSVGGVSFAAHNLTYAPKTVTINDHVQIVQLTGGTLDMRGDAAKIFTSQFIKATGPNSSSSLSSSTHVDIGREVRSSGKPIRIATVNVGGRWYPSLFYTAADSAAGGKKPTAADAVPATGASSGEAAVRAMVLASIRGDLRSVIGLVSPTELGAIHDYGGMILDQVGSEMPSPAVRVSTLDLGSTSISGGAQLITLKRLVLSSSDGGTFSLTVTNGCVNVSANGEANHFCASDAAKLYSEFSSCDGDGIDVPSTSGGSSTPDSCQRSLTPTQKLAFTDLFTSLTKIGVVSTQSGGKWYIAPVRTMAELGSTMLSGLHGNDLLVLMRLAS